MLLPYLLRQAPPITIAYLYFFYFASASWENLRGYYAGFPLNDYCLHVRDPSSCVEHKVKCLAWRRIFLNLFLNTNYPNNGLTQPFLLLYIVKFTHRMYLGLSSPESNKLYIFVRESLYENVKNFQTQTLFETFGFLPKISPITLLRLSLLYHFHPEATTVKISVKLNSSLNILLITLNWKILGFSLSVLFLIIPCLQLNSM